MGPRQGRQEAAAAAGGYAAPADDEPAAAESEAVAADAAAAPVYNGGAQDAPLGGYAADAGAAGIDANCNLLHTVQYIFLKNQQKKYY